MAMRALLASQRSVRRRWLLRKRPKLVAATRPPRLDSAAAPQAAAPSPTSFISPPTPKIEQACRQPPRAALHTTNRDVRIALSPPPLFLHAPPLLRPCAAGPRAPNRGALALRKLRRRDVPRGHWSLAGGPSERAQLAAIPTRPTRSARKPPPLTAAAPPPSHRRRRKDDRQAGDCAARPEGADAEPGQGLLHVRAQRRASLSPTTTTRPSEAADTRCFCASLCCCLSPFTASIAAAACPISSSPRLRGVCTLHAAKPPVATATHGDLATLLPPSLSGITTLGTSASARPA